MLKAIFNLYLRPPHLEGPRGRIGFTPDSRDPGCRLRAGLSPGGGLVFVGGPSSGRPGHQGVHSKVCGLLETRPGVWSKLLTVL